MFRDALTVHGAVFKNEDPLVNTSSMDISLTAIRRPPSSRGWRSGGRFAFGPNLPPPLATGDGSIQARSNNQDCSGTDASLNSLVHGLESSCGGVFLFYLSRTGGLPNGLHNQLGLKGQAGLLSFCVIGGAEWVDHTDDFPPATSPEYLAKSGLSLVVRWPLEWQQNCNNTHIM